MSLQRLALVGAAASAVTCVEARGPEAGDWYDSGTAQDVAEAVEYGDSPYSFPEAGAVGLQDLRHGLLGCYSQETRGECDGSFATDDEFIRILWSPDAPTGIEDCYYEPTESLPTELEVMVTARPQFYSKARNCEYVVGNNGGEPDYDEASDKYYASFFVEDATGGMLVYADQRIAHFDAGDRLTMKVRSVGRAYNMDAVYAYDIQAIERAAGPVFFDALAPTETLGPDHRGRVVRATGTVITEPDDFGTFTIQSEAGAPVNVQLALELNRRGIEFPIGTPLVVTGPVLYSFSSHTIVITQVGQISAQ